MEKQTFNLTTDPWIKVIEQQGGQERTVSLIDLFQHAQDYRQLAGEMRAQDLAILRLLLAILTTVYSRVDATGESYEWLEVTDEFQVSGVDVDDLSQSEFQKAMLRTWRQLQRTGHFSKEVTTYLRCYADRFDFFGQHPFYQATTDEYDALVPSTKKVATGRGQVAVKQINRRISESNSKPAIFAPKTGSFKNKIELAELIRWIVAYQNFTGVTDKTKIVTTEKFSNSAGWLYRLSPVYAQGETLFDTLLLNLVLSEPAQDRAVIQRPVWEYASLQDYVDERRQQLRPTNLAALYTTWSRLLHIEWDAQQQPTIFSAGIPTFSAGDTLIEPMTTWRWNKKETQFRPATKGLRSVGIAMWRNFGQYVRVNDAKDQREPGLVTWLQTLKDQDALPDEQPVNLASVALIGDGNVTSQTPAMEVADDLSLQADVLFDPAIAEHWPTRIEDAIETTKAVGNDFYHFAADIGKIRNIDTKVFAGGWSAQFYDHLNQPFKQWLQTLTGRDNRDRKINEWKQQLKVILHATVQEMVQTSAPRDVIGIQDDQGQTLNLFTAQRRLNYNVQLHLGLAKKE